MILSRSPAQTIGTMWAHSACARCRTMSPIRLSGRAGCARSDLAGPIGRSKSFMDEAAHAAGVDPVAFRVGLLNGTGRNAGSAPNSVGGAKRQAAVLQRAAQKAGWGAAMPKDTGLGIATTFGQERDMPTWTACVARVRVNRSNGRGDGREADDRHRRRDDRAPGRRAGAGRGRRALGAQHGLHEGTNSSRVR